MQRLAPFFPKLQGKPKVDDRHVLVGLIIIIRNGSRCLDAPTAYGAPKTLYNLCLRWRDKGAFARMLLKLAAEGSHTQTLMKDATHLISHQAASSPGRRKVAMNAKLHAVADAVGRLIRMFLSAGQSSGYTGARVLIADLPAATHMLAERDYDADWYRKELASKGITTCIHSRLAWKIQVDHDAGRYRHQHKTVLPV